MKPLEADKGEAFVNFIDRVIKNLQLSDRQHQDIVFNEITLSVNKRSYIEDICHIYDLKSAFRHLQTLK